MWTTHKHELPGNRGLKVAIDLDSSPVPYSEVLKRWQVDPDFRSLFIELLADAPFVAFRWETPPITRASADRPFEFVLLDSPWLDTRPDPGISRNTSVLPKPSLRSPTWGAMRCWSLHARWESHRPMDTSSGNRLTLKWVPNDDAVLGAGDNPVSKSGDVVDPVQSEIHFLLVDSVVAVVFIVIDVAHRRLDRFWPKVAFGFGESLQDSVWKQPQSAQVDLEQGDLGFGQSPHELELREASVMPAEPVETYAFFPCMVPARPGLAVCEWAGKTHWKWVID